MDCSIFKSLDEIDERLDKDWDLTEEGTFFVCRAVRTSLSSLDDGGPEA